MKFTDAMVILFVADCEAAYAMALQVGAIDRTPPHPFLDGKVRVAILEDLDGHPMQLVQKVSP
jgi:hypothetical protein